MGRGGGGAGARGVHGRMWEWEWAMAWRVGRDGVKGGLAEASPASIDDATSLPRSPQHGSFRRTVCRVREPRRVAGGEQGGTAMRGVHQHARDLRGRKAAMRDRARTHKPEPTCRVGAAAAAHGSPRYVRHDKDALGPPGKQAARDHRRRGRARRYGGRRAVGWARNRPRGRWDSAHAAVAQNPALQF